MTITKLAFFVLLVTAALPCRAAPSPEDDKVVRDRLRALHFKDWQRNAHGQLELRLSGPSNGAVGVLHVPLGERPPPINETGHLYIEQIDRPWHVYKTM